MNKRIRELLNQIQNKKAEAQNFLDAKDLAKAKEVYEEIKNLNEALEIEKELFEDEKGGASANNKTKAPKDNIAVKAFMNAIAGKPLTDEMKNALTQSVDTDGGFLVPTEIKTEINELRRDYPSIKGMTDVIPVKTSKGSIVVEDLSTVQNLVDFDEVSDLAEQQPKFKQVQFALKNKGAITPMSNTLLADETAGLPNYVLRNFVKKAIRTENADIFTALTTGKAKKALADHNAVKKAINKDLDPALVAGASIILNQDGFDHFDQLEGADKRPLLQPNPTDATKRTLFGLPVVVVSNSELATTGSATKKAPMLIGNFPEAIKFFDREDYEVASDQGYAGFTKNQTLLRVIERYDVKVGDVDAYINGEIDVTTV